MNFKLLALSLVITTATVSAGEIGSPELTTRTEDVAIGIDYYYDNSQWDTGSFLGNRIVNDLTRDGVIGKIAIRLHDNIELVGKYGLENIHNNPKNSEYGLSTHNDNFFSFAIKGIFYRNDKFAIGPFLQVSEFSNQSISGEISDGVVLHPINATLKNMSTVETGLAAQYRVEKIDIFGGAYYSKADADVHGTFDAIPFKNTLEEDTNAGAYIGINYPITKNLVTTTELHMASDTGIAVGINYLIGHKMPAPVTKTEKTVEVQKVVETVYVEKPPPQALHSSKAMCTSPAPQPPSMPNM